MATLLSTRYVRVCTVSTAPVRSGLAAHAAALGAGDTPEFRRALNRRTAADRNSRLRRYWHLTGQITDEPAPLGVTHTWLLDALDHSVS